MGWKLLKGSEATLQVQLDELGADEIKHFAASIDGGKFAVLAWDGKKAPIGEPKIVEKEVDNPKLIDKIAELKAQLKECQEHNKQLAKANKSLESQNEKLKKALTE